MTRTKEELLWTTPTIEQGGSKWHGRIGVEMAMSEWAEQQAIKFLEWKQDSGYEATMLNGVWYFYIPGYPGKDTSENLYHIFQKGHPPKKPTQ
jgi:hypothetical protein